MHASASPASRSESSTRASTARVASTPTVSADLGARNINISPNTSGIVLVGIVDELTGTDRATEFTGDGGPFYFLSNNFNFADAVTVVKGTFDLQIWRRFSRSSKQQLRRRSQQRHQGKLPVWHLTPNPILDSGFVSGNYNGIGPNDTGSSLANFLLGYSPGLLAAAIRAVHISSRAKKSRSSSRTTGK